MRTYRVDWYHHLPAHVKGILETLHKAGHEAYTVGGCVRDLWLGLPPKDFDLVSSAKPEEIETLFPRTEDVGRQFGIMIVVTDEGSVEVARFRADAEYKDGRHPEAVVFSSPEEDAKRRDFTINALFYDPVKGEVIDYVDGMSDLEARHIRCVGDPALRFQEDALRMLRAPRFHAQLAERDFHLDPSILPAIRAQAERLGLVSRERITQEVCRILLSPRPSVGLVDLVQANLWEAVFRCPPAEADQLTHFDRLAGHYSQVSPQAPELPLLIGAAARWLPAWDWEGGFVLTKEAKTLARTLPALVAALEKFAERDLAGKKTLLADPFYPEGWAVLAAEGASRDDLNSMEAKRMIWEQAGKLNPPPLLKGADLLAAGFPQGPGIKKALEEIRRKQLNEEISTREQALALLNLA